MKNTRIIGVVAAAAMALTAFVGVASASAAQFQAEQYPATLSGQSLEAGRVVAGGYVYSNCYSTLSGEATAASESLKVTPTWQSCTWLGFSGVKINNGGCQFQLQANGTASIVGSGCAISFSGGGCSWQIGPQTASSAVTYANVGTGTSRKIRVNLQMWGLTYSQSGCPGGTGHDGEIKGSWELSGSKSGAKAQGIWLG
ncbi:MAG TPA: hypothetical protein VN732_04005 [Solirubrobacterales bacterium]|nr:hypothetical protein [Solirubrobacterales bacterium]